MNHSANEAPTPALTDAELKWRTLSPFEAALDALNHSAQADGVIDRGTACAVVAHGLALLSTVAAMRKALEKISQSPVHRFRIALGTYDEMVGAEVVTIALGALNSTPSPVGERNAALFETALQLIALCSNGEVIHDIVKKCLADADAHAKLAPNAERSAALIEAKAQKLYEAMTDNDPIVHSNRFPAWWELSVEAKTEWLDKACSLAQPVNERSAALKEALKQARKTIEAAEEELRMIRMKDSNAVYNTLLRSMEIPLALQAIDRALAKPATER